MLKYVKATFNGEKYVIELKRTTEEVYRIKYKDEYSETEINELIKDFLGEWYSGSGTDIEFYGSRVFEEVISNMEITWDYEDIEILTKEEYEEFKGRG